MLCRSDADPSVLAKYVMALVKKDKPVNELIATCQDQLDIFLQESKFICGFINIISRSHSYCLSLPLCLEWCNGSITPWVHSGVTKQIERPSANVE